MAERFFVECSLQPGELELRGAEAHHLVVVCRRRPGDSVCLFNGDGCEYPARVLSSDRRRVALSVDEPVRKSRELPFSFRLAAPLPKGDRAQFLIEKLTELGAAAYVPLVTSRSIIQPRKEKLEKLRRWVIEASKQCGRNVLMEVELPSELATIVRTAGADTLRILAHPLEQKGRYHSEFPIELKGSLVTAAVGPEGGFTPEEIEAARDAGWRILDLGPRVLRVETAAIVLAAWAANLCRRDG